MSQPKKWIKTKARIRVFFLFGWLLDTMGRSSYAAVKCIRARTIYATIWTIFIVTMWNISTSGGFIATKCMRALDICTSAFATYCKPILNAINRMSDLPKTNACSLVGQFSHFITCGPQEILSIVHWNCSLKRGARIVSLWFEVSDSRLLTSW